MRRSPTPPPTQILLIALAAAAGLPAAAAGQNPAPPLFADPLFLTPVSSTGSNPVRPIVVDANQDGHQDIVSPGFAESRVHVILNNGAGNFSNAISTMSGTFMIQVAAADLNHDGIPDIVVSNRGDSTTFPNASVQALLGDGSGGFVMSAEMETSLLTNRVIALGDVNGDGNVDIAISNSLLNPANSPVLLYFGDGLGGFPTNSTIAGANLPPNWLAISDWNGNGSLDVLVTTTSTPSLTHFTNDGAGLFTNAGQASLSTNPLFGIIIDTNHDGAPDAVLGRGGALSLGVYLNNLSNGFQPPIETTQPEVINDLTSGDVNGDGNVDLVVSSPTLKLARLLTSDGTGQFTETKSYQFQNGPVGVALADFDHDSKLDLAVVVGGQTTVLAGDGAGKFGTKPEPLPNLTKFEIADMNLDGRLDIVSPETNNISIYPGDGAGGFGAKVNFPQAFSASKIVIADMNVDGKFDILQSNQSGGFLYYCAGDGAGSIATPSLMLASVCYNFHAGDFTNDSVPDVFVLIGGFGPGYVAPGNGDGTLGALLGPTTGVNGFQASTIGELNGDGSLDVALSPFSGAVTAFFNDGTGNFGTSIHFTGGPGRLFILDINHDDNPDFVVSAGGLGQPLYVYFGTGNGNFAPPVTANNKSATLMADVTGDGEYDFVTYGKVLAGDGLGTFTNIFSFGTYSNANASSTRAADMNNDGMIDLVAGHAVYLNQTLDTNGTVLFGEGTPGCGGIHGLHAISPPNIGNNHFGIVCTGAPPRSLGLALAADAFDPNGNDAFGLGFSVYIDLANAASVVFFDVSSDAAGYGGGIYSIPNDPQLVGSLFLVQMFWLWNFCNPSPLHLSSSTALGVVILP